MSAYGPGEHATGPKYVRIRKNGEQVIKRAAKRARGPKKAAEPTLVATARGAHSRGYQGVLVAKDGTDAIVPCGHRHKEPSEARDCVDPAKEYR